MLEVEFVHIVLGLQGKDLIVCLLGQTVTGLRQVVQLLDTLNDVADLLVVTGVHLVLDGLLLASRIDLLLELLVLTSELVEGVQLLVELVLTKLDLVGVSLDHDLLDLIFLDVLVDSVLLARGERGQLVEPVRPRLHIEAIKRDTEGLTDLWVLDVENALVFLLLELLLGGLNLTCKDHQAPKFNENSGYKFVSI